MICVIRQQIAATDVAEKQYILPSASQASGNGGGGNNDDGQQRLLVQSLSNYRPRERDGDPNPRIAFAPNKEPSIVTSRHVSVVGVIVNCPDAYRVMCDDV